ncbi:MULTISPECIES: hypothetical protein [unclassified Paenibacillus]|uniref:hypothetical protein n=1 Tax=unclassified Paenibacillus TaxID=185978 RepID=UPI001AE502C5|nr:MULTISPECIES: hypothetical protein [unclassified Paenibacillus]MBP1155211.1 quinol monooxygenase YgiN [Paenibacillus sp. PvP091]MBP1169405.1 quinol monooxygenase YgiN [Paenibacillus sp. PvR098]MBP2440433.1 quinol monooxygenase YgiN [Paenibacillus sp. PvP052]
MKIYVVISLWEDQMDNVFVSNDEEKVLSLTTSDFEECDALFVEVWEDGAKIDDYRLQ